MHVTTAGKNYHCAGYGQECGKKILSGEKVLAIANGSYQGRLSFLQVCRECGKRFIEKTLTDLCRAEKDPKTDSATKIDRPRQADMTELWEKSGCEYNQFIILAKQCGYNAMAIEYFLKKKRIHLSLKEVQER